MALHLKQFSDYLFLLLWAFQEKKSDKGKNKQENYPEAVVQPHQHHHCIQLGHSESRKNLHLGKFLAVHEHLSCQCCQANRMAVRYRLYQAIQRAVRYHLHQTIPRAVKYHLYRAIQRAMKYHLYLGHFAHLKGK